MASELDPQTAEQVRKLLAPFRRIASPVFRGFEHVPAQGPRLFVGNHTLFGILDVPFLVLEVYDRNGFLLRGLGDHAHFKIPVWRDFLERYGAVDGTRENCARLMAEGESILVYPGGAREVTKRRHELYQLVWGERLGFARMARAHGCPIVPFASVGVEDGFDILVDGDDVLASPMGPLLERIGWRRDLLPPLVKGLGPTPIPRPERLYFQINEAIDPRAFPDDEAGIRALRDAVAASIERGIRELMAFREGDPYRRLLPRAVAAVRRRLA